MKKHYFFCELGKNHLKTPFFFIIQHSPFIFVQKSHTIFKPSLKFAWPMQPLRYALAMPLLLPSFLCYDILTI